MWPLLERGDTVLLHSDLMRTIIRLRMTPTQIVQSLLDTIGKNGTLILPVFFFSWCEGRDFDIRKPNGETGALGNAALKIGAVRSGNPVYSFAALGKHADLFEMDNYYMLGKGTPFDLLQRLDARVAALDVDDDHCMTMIHHIEKMENAAHRFEKEFSGKYTDWHGRTFTKHYSYFVRYLDIQTHLAPMESLLWDDGWYTGDRPGRGDGMRVIGARDLYKAVAEVLNTNGGEGLLWRRNG